MEDLILYLYYLKFRVLNFSLNRLIYLLIELKKWYRSFLKLEYMDLLNNELKIFFFFDLKCFGRNLGFYVNLWNNDISSLL